jgi:hypothetical protein
VDAGAAVEQNAKSYVQLSLTLKVTNPEMMERE